MTTPETPETPKSRLSNQELLTRISRQLTHIRYEQMSHHKESKSHHGTVRLGLIIITLCCLGMCNKISPVSEMPIWKSFSK